MKPSDKIKQLKESGKEYGVGAAITTSVILALIAVVSAIILALIKVMGDVLVAKYDKPADEVMGIPQTEDWGIKENKTKKISSKNIGLITGAAGIFAFAFYKKQRLKKSKKIIICH